MLVHAYLSIGANIQSLEDSYFSNHYTAISDINTNHTYRYLFDRFKIINNCGGTV